MKIYRGVKNILFKNIQHLFKNKDPIFHDYGTGTSFSYEPELAKSHIDGFSCHSFLLEYDFQPINMLEIMESNCVDDGVLDYGIFINGDIIKKKELSNYCIKNGYDSVLFCYDDYDTHLFISPIGKESQLTLKKVLLFSDNIVLKKKLQSLNFIEEEENYFLINPSSYKQIDEILSNF